MKKNSLFCIICFACIANFCHAQTFKNVAIAHRGAWLKDSLPQNSIASLRRAIELRCAGSEFDVWMTGDSVLVINHDPVYKGMKIESSTYHQLASEKLDNGETIPTLEEYPVGKRSENYQAYSGNKAFKNKFATYIGAITKMCRDR